jgi:amino acid adenylation domain-containing protein
MIATSIHAAVLARARSQAAAFDGPDGPVTYEVFAAAVGRLATSLRDRLRLPTRVALLARKSPAAVTGMLGALAAGHAYVPVDASAPVERQRLIIQDAACGFVLAGTGLVVPDGLDVPTLTLPDRLELIEPRAPALGRWAPGHADREAYVLYTSGSTGTPKGVVITHRNAMAFVSWARRAFPLSPSDRVAVHAPLHFDLPVYDVYAGLAAGATLCPVPEEVAMFPQGLLRFLAESRVTHLYAVPSALTALVRRSTLRRGDLPALRRVLYAGEEFRPQPLSLLMDALPQATVANLYGPIETNVVTSMVVESRHCAAARIPIGRPVDGAIVALRDEHGASEVAPMEGEIVVSGDCVTPGYLGRPDLTAAAMVDLVTESGPNRFYRTGDFARRDEQGLLHLLGRRDGLVKTRGYRVELGEIESAIASLTEVLDVCALAEPDALLTNRIHAAVVASGEPDRAVEAVLRHCRAHLPSYLVPTAVHVLPSLPRTSTGKIARAAVSELVLAREAPAR